MEGITFERLCRTPHSEAYSINRGEERAGRVDLHYGSTTVYGTLVVELEFSEDEVSELIELVDEQLVLTADVERDDFQVAVFQGKELGFFSDDYYDDDDEEGEEEEG